MCPIHDTDSAEERWSKAEWEHYELWEKQEARRRGRRRWVLLAGWLVFFVLSSVPIVVDRKPQWLALRALRELGSHLTQLKREAGERQMALRVVIAQDLPLTLRVESAPDCSSGQFQQERTIVLLEGHPKREEFGWLDPRRGQEAGIPGLLGLFCYDSRKGSSVTPGAESVAGFAVLPVKELTGTPDHYSLLLLRGPSAEISFE